MTPSELIGAVAAEYLADMMEIEPDGTLRFCIVGFNPELTSSIAFAAASHPRLEELEIHVPQSLADHNVLNPNLESGQAAVNLRHKEPDYGKRAILFAIDSNELITVGKSAEMLTRIDSGTIRRAGNLWGKVSCFDSLTENDQYKLSDMLEGLERSGVARTLESFADYVGRVANLIKAGKATLADAFDRALPALRIPCRSGGFAGRSDIRDRVEAPREWEQRFQRVARTFQPLLHKETEKGELIDCNILKKNLDAAIDQNQIGDEEATAVKAFLEDMTVRADGWSDSQRALCELEWERIAVVFEGLGRQAPMTLGQETLKHFKNEFPKCLVENDTRLLESVRSNMREVPAEVTEFFHMHREEISTSRSLSVKWEKLIFSVPETYNDFLEGLVSTIHRLIERADSMPNDPVILVDLKNSEKKSFWDKHNARLNKYFKLRYRGISQVCGAFVEFRFGRAQSLPEEDLEIGDRAKSKTSLEFKFDVFLLSRGAIDDEAARRKAPCVQFVWTQKPQYLALSLVEDLAAITADGRVRLAGAKVARKPISVRGEIQRIMLNDAATIRDAHEGSEGRLYNPDGDLSDLAAKFRKALDEMTGNVLETQQAARVRKVFEVFEQAYSTALRQWVMPTGAGIGSAAFIEQAEAYGQLLRTLREDGGRDVCRERLWRPILSIGVAYVSTGGQAAIITPWHPLRMAEVAVKARQMAEVARKVVSSSLEEVEGAEIFFRQICRALSSPYWPEACLDGASVGGGLLTVTETLGDYSLMEPPTRGARNGEEEHEEALDTEAVAAARHFARISEEYLELLPHERANFSVVLYNADSKDLPSTLADELTSKVERERDLRCDLLLSHDDKSRMRQMYEQQNAAVGDDGGSSLSSEAARTFMSRLRVGFADADSFTSKGSRAADLVFLQDVVARGANLCWRKTPISLPTPRSLEECEPLLWSRRCPIARGDTRAASYLAAPLQPGSSQAYLDALHDIVVGHNPGSHWLPAREVSFTDGTMRRVIEKAHKMGDWVVSYDAIADRRLLESQKISIIRYINNRDSSHNLIVSTSVVPRLLQVILNERLSTIMPAIPEDRRNSIVEKLYGEALKLSGQIVMRAARHGNYASELIGVVLSKEQACRALGDASPYKGWFFLDDYSTWLGRKEGQVADLLALAPTIGQDGNKLRLIVTESKFISGQNCMMEARRSASQLYETVERLGRALKPSMERIDRKLWLHRIGDLMIEGMEPFESGTFGEWDLLEWSRRVREGEVPIQILGMSHVFIHDQLDTPLAGEEPLKGCGHCRQRIFSKVEVRELLDAFYDGIPGGVVTEWEEALAWHPAKGEVLPNAEAPPAPGPEELFEKSSATDAPGSSPDVEVTAKSEPVLPDAGVFPAEVLEWLQLGPVKDEAPGDTAWLEDVVIRLRKALLSYQMTAELIDSRLTPNAALIRLRGSNELTVKRVEARQVELLTTHALNVINVLQAPGEIVVMVSRPKRTVLGFREMWSQRVLPLGAPQICMSLLLGAREANGEPLHLNLGEASGGQPQHGPHTLIAGETGSGKGILVQNLLLDLCATNSPKLARIIMIDPKAGVDFAWLKRMPHLDGGLITTQDKAVEVLEALVSEMERRYFLFADVGANKLSRYNKIVPPEEKLPAIFLFHDELADWMLMDDYRSAVQTSVNRLGVKARAAGIHLFFITQRPDKDALPMQLRANLTNRLVLKVSDKRNSELVLDEAGAERLLGRGHMAARLSGEGGTVLAQVPFLEEDGAFSLAGAIVRAWEGERPKRDSIGGGPSSD